MRPRAALLAVCAAAAVGAPAAGVFASSPPSARDGGGGSACPQRNTKTIAADRVVRVYEYTRTAKRHRGWVESCVLASGHRLSLDARGFYDVARPPSFDLSRYAFAYVRSTVDENGANVDHLVVGDARKGLRGDRGAEPPLYGSLANVVVRPNESFAWSAQALRGSRVYRWRASSDKPELLAHGKRLDERSLTLHGTRLSWRQAGRTRHATLR